MYFYCWIIDVPFPPTSLFMPCSLHLSPTQAFATLLSVLCIYAYILFWLRTFIFVNHKGFQPTLKFWSLGKRCGVNDVKWSSLISTLIKMSVDSFVLPIGAPHLKKAFLKPFGLLHYLLMRRKNCWNKWSHLLSL